VNTNLILPAYLCAGIILAVSVAIVQGGSGGESRFAFEHAASDGDATASSAIFQPEPADASRARVLSRVNQRVVTPAQYFAHVQEAHNAAREQFDGDVFADDGKPAKKRLEIGAATSRIFTEQMDEVEPPAAAVEAHQRYRQAAHELRVLFSSIYHDIAEGATFEDLQDIVYEDDARLAVFDRLGEAACELQQVARDEGHEINLHCEDA
jgi:hypothetical protein